MTTKSIAVLPFVNLSKEAGNEYFSDGITEEIINALTVIVGLKVIARTSSFAFKNRNIDVRTIGKQLGVNTILEGSVRKVAEKIRITAQLINTEDGSHFWSKNFDRELKDIFEVQDEISLLIADRIRENFGHFEIQDHLVTKQTSNIEAYNYYLKGRYHQLKWNLEDLLKGIELYKKSIELDSTFVLPYLAAALSYGIVASWGFIDYKKGIAQAEKYLKEGLNFKEKSYLGYFAKATIYLWGKWDFQNAHKQFQKSMELNSSFTDAEEGLTELYTATGYFKNALNHSQRIISLNPLSPNHYYTQGNIHYLSSNFKMAVASLEHALKLDASFSLAIETIAACYIQLNLKTELIDHINRYPSIEQPALCLALLELVNNNFNKAHNKTATDELKNASLTKSLIPWNLYMLVYLDEFDAALNLLEEGIHIRKGQFINFKYDPFLRPLSSIPRFKKLCDPFKVSFELEDAIGGNITKKSILSPDELKHYLGIIPKRLVDEELFLNPNITLKSFAEEIDVHANKLSWLINEHIGKNFNEYINTFRLEAFKEKAKDPKNSHLTLLGLAYESGFNSKTVFNSFFKKIEGVSPSYWLKSIHSG